MVFIVILVNHPNELLFIVIVTEEYSVNDNRAGMNTIVKENKMLVEKPF